MQWLTPLTAVFTALAAIPALLLLYFLKLKRREYVVSSTFLWKRAVQDLQVNAPFQRLRRNILLLLQLLMLLAILAAIGGPLLLMKPGAAKRYVLLIDRSASMASTDIDPTRLDEAKRQAKVFVKSMRNQGAFGLGKRADEAMIVAFDDHADVMCNFTSDKRQLDLAIEAIDNTDGKSMLAEAITVGRAFAQAPGVEGNIRTAEDPAQLMLFSDGRIGDLEEIVVSEGELEFHCVGLGRENIAITAMQARRSYEDPEEVTVFASLNNYGPDPVSCDVQLSIDADVRAVRSLTIDPPSPGSTPFGTGVVSFTVRQEGSAVIEVRQLHEDSLAGDDAAWTILPAPRKLSVLLVTAGNVALESALRACSLETLELCTPSRFDAMEKTALEIEQPYDVIVLDNHVRADLPKCRYLVFGRPPQDVDVSVAGQLANEVIVDWKMQHPVLKYVNLDNLFAVSANKMDLPRDADVLAEFSSGPAISALHRNASVFILTAFDCLETNWPFEPGFVVYCHNAISFLASQSAGRPQANLAVGEPVRIEAVPPGINAAVEGPDLESVEIQASPSGVLRFAGTNRAGLYRMTWGDDIERLFAVNLLDDGESNIDPLTQLNVGGAEVTAEQEIMTRANVQLWPWLVFIALVIACGEWLVYNHKMRI